MATMREAYESICYPHMEKLMYLVIEEGFEAELCGNKGFKDDKDTFTAGSAFQTMAVLYNYYVREGDLKKAEDAKKALYISMDICIETGQKTWGILSILRGLNQLNKCGNLGIITEDYMQKLVSVTDYASFYDAQTFTMVQWLPTNYLHVVLACAGFRHYMGWEDDVVMKKASEQFLETLNPSNGNGWMDETKDGKGRYDRYSMIIASEVADTLDSFGLEVPQFLKDNLRLSAEQMLFMANKYGDGVNFGRSLSTHGDSAAMEVLASALKQKVLDDKNKDRAVAYMIAIAEKMRKFWYDKELGAFNICLNGRATNSYRSFHRFLQLNLNMCTQLLASVRKMEEAGLADYEPDYTFNDKYEIKKLEFEKNKRVLYSIKDKGRILSLAFVGTGNHYLHAAYYPVPFLNREIEAPPEKYLPFMWPEIIYDDGRVAIPVQYIDTVSDEICDNGAKIECSYETLVLVDHDSRQPQPIENGDKFKVKFDIKEGEIVAEFDFDFEDYTKVKEVRFVSTNENVTGFGCEWEDIDPSGEEFDTPHGHRNYAIKYTACPSDNKLEFGYVYKFR